MAQDTPIAIPQLNDNNPYFNGSVAVFDDGTLALDPAPFIYTKSNADRYYTAIDLEEIGIIAFQGYGDSKLWHVPAKANNIFDPFSLDSGLTLLIPDLNHLKVNQL